MRKENGRLTPAEQKEIANLYGKELTCSNPDCKHTETISRKEFGAAYKCSKCGAILEEGTFWK